MSEMANTKERSGELARIAIAALEEKKSTSVKYLFSQIISLSQTVQAVPRSRLCLMK